MIIMQNEPIIRPILADEVSVVRRLIYTIAHPLMEPQLTLDELIARWEGWGVFSDLDDVQANYFDRNGVFLVVEIAGQLVGTGAFAQFEDGGVFGEHGRLRTQDERLISGEGVCTLHRITLLPNFGGKKIGYLAYALMIGLIERARELGYTRIVLWTDPIKLHHAVDFYHRLGFIDISIDGVDPDELWLQLDI
jgi:GNAT superfamily N-acetyltransferase